MAKKIMIHYNMDFLIAALVLLFLLLHHFTTRKKLLNTNNRIFQLFIWLGLIDVLLDILSSLMIMNADESMNVLAEFTTSCFYLIQVLVIYAFMCYIKSLRYDLEGKLKKVVLFWLIPAIIMAILIIINHWNGMMFYFTSSGEYIRGPYNIWMYLFALVYVVLAAVDSVIHYKDLGNKRYVTIWAVIIVAGICVIIQAASNHLLMTGFGIGLVILILYLSISNPDGSKDSLTEVFDKQSFLQWYDEYIGRNKKLHLISLDIYRLRKVNKIYGLKTGDKLLICVAEMLRYVSKTSHIFRVTGDRFLIAVTSVSEYEQIRDKVKAYFEQSFIFDGETIHVPVIICGILDAHHLKESNMVFEYIDYLVNLLPDTDESSLIQGDSKTLEGFLYEQEIERFLDEAIEQDLFEVYYQPVYSFENVQYISLECLSRLKHPKLGYVSPAIFISIAEKNGQITKIGYLQFCKICKFVKENEEIMKVIHNVKFNLSPAEILKNEYGKSLIEVIRKYNLPADYFQFEITETVATEYSEQLYRTIELFKEAGIGLCLDDFGSGYANLNTVLKLPFSSIKIDRSLLQGICVETSVADFYKNIVGILQGMGYLLIAEGVETEEEVNLLRGWGIDMVQGFYFSKPVNSEEIYRICCQNVKK
ncbi:MAG: EAL domain-containing protein [Lachnospiraceae bacterium]|nr:EAL domain-containing protein [Lachnospiraceae bacterium]